MLINQLPNLALSLIDLRDSSVLAISDISAYSTVPTTGFFLQITVPGYPTVNNVTFTPGSVNVYRCSDLGLTCSEAGCTPLPDGNYEVKYSLIINQANEVTNIDQKFIKIDQIKCKYQHAFLQVDIEYGPRNQNYMAYIAELRVIKLYIDGSVAESNNSNYALSYEYYKKAYTMLEKLSSKFPGSKWKQCSTC